MHSIPKSFPSQNTFGDVKRRMDAAFSLVEVSAAIGIVAFAFVAVLGLLSTGLGHFRDAMDRTVTAQVAARVLNDAQQSEFSALVGESRLAAQTASASPDSVTLRYFDEQGNEVTPAEAGTLSDEERLRVIYYAGTRVRPYAAVPRESASASPTLAQVTVQVAHYAGRAPLEVSASSDETGNLLNAPAGAPVFTYSALIARVQ